MSNFIEGEIIPSIVREKQNINSDVASIEALNRIIPHLSNIDNEYLSTMKNTPFMIEFASAPYAPYEIEFASFTFYPDTYKSFDVASKATKANERLGYIYYRPIKYIYILDREENNTETLHVNFSNEMRPKTRWTKEDKYLSVENLLKDGELSSLYRHGLRIFLNLVKYSADMYRNTKAKILWNKVDIKVSIFGTKIDTEYMDDVYTNAVKTNNVLQNHLRKQLYLISHIIFSNKSKNVASLISKHPRHIPRGTIKLIA